MSKGRRSQAKKGQQEMENGNRFSPLQEDDDQWMTPNGGRDGQRRVHAAVDGPDEPRSPAQERMTPNGGRNGQRRVQAAGDGPDEPSSPAQEQGSIRDAFMDDEVVSELGSQVSKTNQVKYSIQVDVPKPGKLTAEDSDELQKVKVVQDGWDMIT